jgi:virginiamycin A acetyltransferase
MLLGGNHRADWITTFPFWHIYLEEFPRGSVHGADGHPVSKGDIVIMNDVWIGYGCTVLSGVTIGNGSILAARSVVTKDVPPYSIVGGNPARVLKYRFNPEVIDLLLKISWWDEDDIIINAVVPMLQSMATLDDVVKLRDIILALKHSM